MRRLATATASASSATATSTTPFGACTDERADRVGLERAQAAALDHRRAAHPERGALGGDDQVRAAGEHRVAGEAPPGDDRDPRHDAREPAPERERARVERRDDRVVGVAGPPAAALGEAARWAGASARSARTGGPSCGARSRPACRPAPCSRRRAPRRRRARRESSPLIARGPGDQAVGGRARDQLRRRRGGRAARRSRARRTRRSCPRRRGRRGSRGRCVRRPRGGARPPRDGPRRWSAAGARAPRRGRRGRRPPAPRKTRIRLGQWDSR